MLEYLASEAKENEAAAMREEWQAEVSMFVAIFQEPWDPKPRETFHREYKNTLMERSIFRTQEGYLGLGPYITQPGDLVCVLFGLNVPYVLRAVNEGFLLIGECYVHGVMHGEKLEEGRCEEREFKII